MKRDLWFKENIDSDIVSALQQSKVQCDNIIVIVIDIHMQLTTIPLYNKYSRLK